MVIAMGVWTFVIFTFGFWRYWNLKHENSYIACERLYILNFYISYFILHVFDILSLLLSWYKYDKKGRYIFICGGGGVF